MVLHVRALPGCNCCKYMVTCWVGQVMWSVYCAGQVVATGAYKHFGWQLGRRCWDMWLLS